jgi:light-regulated signal transduction histidine kinase (bacteriophytochrome)
MVEKALGSLKRAISESTATIEIGDLPVICADPNRIGQLFENLLGNAMKYKCPDRNSFIYISAERQRNGWLFKIADNGIGIPRHQQEKIFEPFRRLHGQTEFPGTGIGLAICRKIIEQRGGTIGVESEGGRGSIFYFSIPDELP